MKCVHCNAEWNVNPAMAASIHSCPFCGKPLKLEEDNSLESLSGGLKAIIAHGSIESLRDGRRALAMFGDLAPKLKRERIMFSYLVQCEGNIALLDALQKPRSEQITCRAKIALQMVRDLLINEDVAYETCDAFWDAIGGQSLSEKPQATIIAPTHTPVSQPANTATPPISFWAELFDHANKNLSAPISGFFASADGGVISGSLEGNTLILKGCNLFATQSISYDIVVTTIAGKATQLLGKAVSVKIVDSQGREQELKKFTPPKTTSPVAPPASSSRQTANTPTKPVNTLPSYPKSKPIVLEEKKRSAAELFQQGVQFEKGYNAPKNPQRAIQLYTEAATQGHMDAMFNLAQCYSNGVGVTANPAEAYRWYQRAAEKGHVRSMLQLGLCYKDGIGTTQNAAESLRWIRMAAMKGDAKAKYMLSSTDSTAVPVLKASAYEKDAKSGNANAQYNYAKCFATGSNGVSRNYALAAEYYEKAAKQGHGPAQLAIAEMYEKGQGVMVSLAKATEYYQLAAQSPDSTIAHKANEALRQYQPSAATSWFKKMFGKG